MLLLKTFYKLAWWHMFVIPALRLKQEDSTVKASLGYLASLRPALHSEPVIKPQEETHLAVISWRLQPQPHSLGPPFYPSSHQERQCCCRVEWAWLRSCFHQTMFHSAQGGLQRDLQTGQKTRWCTGRQARAQCCPRDPSALNLIWNKETMWMTEQFPVSPCCQ